MKKNREHGWLIEGEEGGKIVWLSASASCLIWTSNNEFALRFSRSEDALAMAKTHCNNLPGDSIGGLSVTEHIWE